MARTCFSKATHAIIGTTPPKKEIIDGEEVEWGPGSGVLHWHDNELDAHRDCREMRKDGAVCHVVASPGGELGDAAAVELDYLIFGELVQARAIEAGQRHLERQ